MVEHAAADGRLRIRARARRRREHPVAAVGADVRRSGPPPHRDAAAGAERLARRAARSGRRPGPGRAARRAARGLDRRTPGARRRRVALGPCRALHRDGRAAADAVPGAVADAAGVTTARRRPHRSPPSPTGSATNRKPRSAAPSRRSSASRRPRGAAGPVRPRISRSKGVRHEEPLDPNRTCGGWPPRRGWPPASMAPTWASRGRASGGPRAPLLRKTIRCSITSCRATTWSSGIGCR